MSMDFLKNDFEKVNYLLKLLTAKATGSAVGFADSVEFEALRAEVFQNSVISKHLPQWLRTHRSLDAFWGYIKPKFESYAERRAYLSEEFSAVLDTLEFGQPTSKTTRSPSKDNSQQAKNTGNKRKVFVVHGRDNETKQETARFIEQLGLEAIVLHEQASSGKTIIEKIEHYSNDADFALILYTACDHGRGIHESKSPPKNRARQNVIFEHGYLIAKLGRQNVCALLKGEIETPNDISGIVYVPMDDSGAWKNETIKELRACGYTIKNQ